MKQSSTKSNADQTPKSSPKRNFLRKILTPSVVQEQKDTQARELADKENTRKRSAKVEEKQQDSTFAEFLRSGDVRAHELFSAHLKREFSAENLEFWQGVQDFLTNPTAARICSIYDRFVKDGAEQEINISADHRIYAKLLVEKLEMQPVESRCLTSLDLKLATSIFSEIQQVIEGLMESDSWGRFRTGPMWEVYCNAGANVSSLSVTAAPPLFASTRRKSSRRSSRKTKGSP